jgi:hypothetical protein
MEISGFQAHDNEAIPLWTFLSLSISICVFAPLEAIIQKRAR